MEVPSTGTVTQVSWMVVGIWEPWWAWWPWCTTLGSWGFSQRFSDKAIWVSGILWVYRLHSTSQCGWNPPGAGVNTRRMPWSGGVHPGKMGWSAGSYNSYIFLGWVSEPNLLYIFHIFRMDGWTTDPKRYVWLVFEGSWTLQKHTSRSNRNWMKLAVEPKQLLGPRTNSGDCWDVPCQTALPRIQSLRRNYSSYWHLRFIAWPRTPGRHWGILASVADGNR